MPPQATQGHNILNIARVSQEDMRTQRDLEQMAHVVPQRMGYLPRSPSPAFWASAQLSASHPAADHPYLQWQPAVSVHFQKPRTQTSWSAHIGRQPAWSSNRGFGIGTTILVVEEATWVSMISITQYTATNMQCRSRFEVLSCQKAVSS